MKFEDAKVGMPVSVTGEHSVYFPNGAEVLEKDSRDNSIRIGNRKTGRTMWFFDKGVSFHTKDLHPSAESTSTKPCFRKLPLTTLKVATYLGLDAEKVTCYVDKENGTVTVRQGDKEAKAKKSPKDTWDFRLGMGLALCRLKDKVSETKKPPFNTPYFYVMTPETTHDSLVGIIPTYFSDGIRYAMGNTFYTQEEAESNRAEMTRRAQMIVDFCKKQGW